MAHHNRRGGKHVHVHTDLLCAPDVHTDAPNPPAQRASGDARRPRGPVKHIMAATSPATAPGERAGVELLSIGKGEKPDDDDELPMTLGDLLAIALVPATVPAGVLVIALLIAVGLGTLPPALRSCFEQIAGGALLITYLKEIFPRVVERLDEAVEALGPTTAATRRTKHRRWFGLVLLVVMTTIFSVVVQAWAEHWPGLRVVLASADAHGSGDGTAHDSDGAAVPCVTSKAGRAASSAPGTRSGGGAWRRRLGSTATRV